MSSAIADIPGRKSPDSKKSKPDFLILSGGVVGFSVAKLLCLGGHRVSIVDIDQVRVETLRQAGFDAIFGDPSSKEIFSQIDTKNLICVAALSSSDEINAMCVENFRTQLGEDTIIVSRLSDELKKETLIKAGADNIFNVARMISGSICEYMERMESKHSGNKLAACLEENRGRRLGIVLHDNPDPDAISCGFALKEIADVFGIESEILYAGKIGHQENKAFVNLLHLHMTQISSPDIYSEFDKLAMVDCSKPQANNSVPADADLMVVIDHHPTGGPDTEPEFMDIRTNVGAAATIMTRYMQQLDIPISKELATALLFGIRTDTNDFRRNTTAEDFSAASYLHPIADHDLLKQVETTTVSQGTLDVLGEAIHNRILYGRILITNAGFIREKDALPQAADSLLQLEGISTSLVYAILDNNIVISARNTDIRIHLGDVMKQAFGDNAGGHSTMAAAQIPLGVFDDVKDKDMLIKLVGESVTRKFLSAMGYETEEPENQKSNGRNES